MTNDPFDSPASSSGVQWEGLNGRLLMIKPLAQEKDIPTVHGNTDAVRAHIVVVDAPGGAVEYRDTLIFPKVLQANVRPNIGSSKFTLGRLGQGAKKTGQSAPWVLIAATDEDKRTAAEYLASGTPAASADAQPAAAGAGGKRPW